MPDNLELMIGAAVLLLIEVGWMFLKMKSGPSVPAALRLGQALPEFMATYEQGKPVRSTQLVGLLCYTILFSRASCHFHSTGLSLLPISRA